MSTPQVDGPTLRNIEYSLREPTTALSAAPTIQYRIPQQVFDKIHHACQTATSESGCMFVAFSTADLPTRDVFEQLICLYFDSFQPHFPMLHEPTFADADPHWLLILAMAAIGSNFLDRNKDEVFSGSLHEALRRILIFAVGLSESSYHFMTTNSVLGRESVVVADR